MKINDRVIENREITLGPGETRKVTYTYTAEAPGTYKVDLNGLTSSLEVTTLPEFQVGSLEISPSELITGSSFTVDAEVKTSEQ